MESSTAIRRTRHLDATAIPVERRDRADSRRVVAALRDAGLSVTAAAVDVDGTVDLWFDAEPGAAFDTAWENLALPDPPDPRAAVIATLNDPLALPQAKFAALADLLPKLRLEGTPHDRV
jgi:hypothetical protein